MKRQFLLMRMLLLFALIVGSTNVWGQVASVAPENEKSYVVAAYVNSKYYALPNGTVGGSTIDGAEISLNALNKVNTSDAAGKTWTLQEGTDDNAGKYYFKYTSGTDTYWLYKNGTGKDNHNFAVNKTSKNYWAFTTNGTGYTVAAVGRGTNNPNIQCNSGTFRCYSSATPIILLEIGDVPAYTVTAESNNNTYGTVSLENFVITASPNDGYRVSSSAPYSISPIGSATVAQDGNKFTVTPSANTTITINFEAIPTHSVSCLADPVAGGSVEAVSTTVREGETTNVTATANSGYKFTGWTVTGTGASLSSTSTNPTTLTMGTADATVTASFEAVVTHEIKWSVNGTIIKTENVEENTDLDFSEPTSGIPSGYTFKGWVVEANKINTPTDTDPSASYVTSGKSTEDITYYAVMAQLKTASSETTITLKNKTIQDNAAGKSSYSNDYNIENWTGRYLINNYSGNYTLQLGYNTDSSKSAYNSHLTTPSASENIQSITIEANQAVTFYLCSATNLGTAAEANATYGYGSTTNSNKTITINVSGDTKQLHIYPSGTANIKSISMTYGTPAVYKNYCCTVPDINVTVSSVSYATFSDDVARDFSESGIKVYTAKATTSTVSFTEVNDGIVPANVGVVLYKDGGTTGSVAIPAVETAKTSLSENEMVANVERTKVSATGEGGKTNYILSNETAGVGFYKAATGDGAYLAAHRAYLSTGAAASRSFLGFDDETTGIESIDVSTENTNVAREYYNLNGQRVTTPTKGLYIVNGKKVIINK